MSNPNVPLIGKSKASFVESNVQWGLYYWKLPDGHLFNIPSMKGDLMKMAEIRKAAAHYGQPEGSPWFYPGLQRATDEEHKEQVDRMKEGLIPTMNDFGAVIAAKKSLELYGDAE